MGGVDDHRGGGGYLVHHAAARQVAADAPDALLHERIAFHFLEFVADVLLAHFEVVLVAPLLAEEIHSVVGVRKVDRRSVGNKPV